MLRHPLPEVHRANGSSGRRRGHPKPTCARTGRVHEPSFEAAGSRANGAAPDKRALPPRPVEPAPYREPACRIRATFAEGRAGLFLCFPAVRKAHTLRRPQPGRPRTPARYPSRVPTPKRSSPRRKARTRQRAYSRAYRPASGARVLCAAPGATRASPPPAPCGARRFRRGRSRSRAAPDRCLQPAMSPTSVLRAGSGKEPRGDPRPRTSRGGAFRFPAGPAPIPHSQAP